MGRVAVKSTATVLLRGLVHTSIIYDPPARIGLSFSDRSIGRPEPQKRFSAVPQRRAERRKLHWPVIRSSYVVNGVGKFGRKRN